MKCAWLAFVVGCSYPVLPPLEGGGDGGSGDGNGDSGDASTNPGFASCQGLPATCAGGDCCAATMVAGGAFIRSHDKGNDGAYPSLMYPANVSSFVLDKFEVTVGRFRTFVAAGMGTQANPPPVNGGSRTLNGMPNQGGWQATWASNLVADEASLRTGLTGCSATYATFANVPNGNEAKPINCVTWYEAMAFCIWDGGFLPTEAEWNYAAAGGSEQRAYPWSINPTDVAIDCTHANYKRDNPAGSYCKNGMTGAASLVGELPNGNGMWGHADLSGNVSEWTLDYYQSPYPTTTCDDCANLSTSVNRGWRGGSFYDLEPILRPAHRGLSSPTQRGYDLGFRCARFTPRP